MFLHSFHKELFSFLEEAIPCHQKRKSFHQEHEGGGGGGSQDVVSYTNLLPTYIPNIQTWATEYITSAMAMATAPGNFTEYTDPTYAAQNANEIDGISALALRGASGAAVEAYGKDYLRDLYDGLLLNTNSKIAAFYAKKIEALLEEFDDSVMPIIQHQHVFSFGGSDHNIEEAKAAKRMMAKINEIASMFYEDYIQERQLMHQGMAHATPYGLQCIRDGEMLMQAGKYEREYDQAGKMDTWEHYNEVQLLPIRNLDILGNAVRTILSTQRVQTTQYHKPSQLSQIAGLALTGLSIATMFSGGAYARAGMEAAGSQAASKAYSPGMMGFSRDNPEMIGQ